MEAAKVANIVEAKMKHSTMPLSLRMVHECVDLSGATETQVKWALRSLCEKGKVRKVPISYPGNNDRVGFEWLATALTPKPSMPPPIKKVLDEVRLKINDDHSVTITTPKIRVTIEVPL
jgi:hypothetical protein